MSFLDLYHGDQQQALRVQPTEGHDLPATFGESFRAAWDYGRLFQQSVAGENARQEALGDYIDDVRQQTGKDPAAGIDWSAMGMGGALPADMLRGQVNGAVDKINVDRPPDQAIPTLSSDDLEQLAVQKSQAAGRTLAGIEGREHSGFGAFLGGAAAAATDPVNLLALPLAPEADAGIVANALRFGGVAAASQAAIEGVGAPYHEEVQPGYLQSGAPVGNVLEAGASGAVLGGTIRALGNAWTFAKTGAWPTSVKDAGNVLESEAHVAGTNVYDGAEGEAAHRDAMATGIDQVLNEQPVDVSKIITPEIEARARTLTASLETQAGGANQYLGAYDEGPSAFRLPAFNQRAVALTSEEAALRERLGQLGETPEITETNTTAADRLNRLQAVDAQLQTATGDVRKALLERRDQILVDTTPEQLQADAAPIEQARTLEAERQQIGTRLAEIEQERSAARAESLGAPQAMIGQRMPVRPPEVPTFEAAEPPTVPAPEQVRQMVESPEHQAALQSDIEREQVAEVGRQIPVDVDKDGNVIYRSIDDMANEAEQWGKVADQIAACAAPAPEEPTNG